MRVIGVDPGIRGAVVVVDAAQSAILAWHALRRHYVRVDGIPVLSPQRIVTMLRSIGDIFSPVLAAIERPIVAPSAQTRTVSAWSTAACAAVLGAAAVDAGVEPVFVAASRWKSRFGLRGEHKSAVLGKFREHVYWQAADEKIPPYLEIAIAEAALVALTAWEDWRANNQADNN